MSGHRSIILLLMLFQLTSVGCQTDGTSRFAWNPFRKKTDADAVADADKETPPVSKSFFTRNKEEKEETESAPPMAAEQLERLLSQGRLALQENRIEEAKKAYNDVLQSLPDNATAHHGLAMAADLTEEWDDAEYHYRQALRIRPRDPDLLCDIGYSYLLQNRYSEAESYLNHALEVSPQHESALMNLAMLDLRQGKRASAERRLADRFGSSGRATQVMAQLEEQVASLGGGIIPASASSVSNITNEASALRPDITASAQNVPEVPPNASLEEVLAIARREGVEAERRRGTQNIPQDLPTNSRPISSAPQSGNAPHQPLAWPGNSHASMNQPHGGPPATTQPALGQPVTGQPVGGSPSGYSGQPTHVFGTLQPRNPNAGMGNVSVPTTQANNATAAQHNSANSAPPGHPDHWASSSPNNSAPNFLHGASNGQNPAGQNGVNSQPSAAPSMNMNSMAGTTGQSIRNGAANINPSSGTNNGFAPNGGMASNAASAQPSFGNGPGAAPASSLPNGGAPIAVRSSGTFQPPANTGNSYGMPYGFGAGQPPVNTVSNTTSTPINGQPNGAANSSGNTSRPAPQGMYLDALNVGPGSLFPMYPDNAGMNATGTPAAAPGNLPQNAWPGNSSNPPATNGANSQSGSPQANMNPNAANAGNGQNNVLRMGNISSPGSGSMINGAMFGQPNSNVPANSMMTGGGANNLPGWPGARAAQPNPLESYERQRQQLDDEYNRTLEQLDRNNPASHNRAQY